VLALDGNEASGRLAVNDLGNQDRLIRVLHAGGNHAVALDNPLTTPAAGHELHDKHERAECDDDDVDDRAPPRLDVVLQRDHDRL